MTETYSIGSTLSDFLEEDGIREEAELVAIKRVFAWQIAEKMREAKLSKAEMARRLATSRSQLDRLLDPDNPRVQLDTLYKAARAVGSQLRLEVR